MNADALNDAMVEDIARFGSARPEILAAFRSVKRHLFVTGVDLPRVYTGGEAIATRFDGRNATSSSSAPFVMAVMLEQLDPQPGQRWLEIGAGTGYNAAIIATLIRPGGTLTTIDVQDDVAREAAERLTAAGFPEVRVVAGEGWLGAPDDAPFDRIEVTASCDDISPRWVEQLAPGGLLLLPLQLGRAQALVCFRKETDRLVSESIKPGGFLPLRGHGAAAPRWPVALVAYGWSLLVPPDLELPIRSLTAILAAEPQRSAGWVPGQAWALLDFEPDAIPVALMARDGEARQARRYEGLLDPDARALVVTGQAETLAFGDAAVAEGLLVLLSRPADAWRIEAVPRGALIDTTGARVLERSHHSLVARLR